ncbi:hypothetical protein R3P38DRAFT_3181202 [Favolaschia claudopus]|uniref:SAM domain-containing protein n=1 Tax=Favolaschia claudopus TaxID=2862362 RepID=A0AAW0CJV1_9AGAR
MPNVTRVGPESPAHFEASNASRCADNSGDTLGSLAISPQHTDSTAASSSTHGGFHAHSPAPDNLISNRDQFCEKYNLSKEIRELLVRYNIQAADTLLDADHRSLRELGFKLGHIAELNWALTKMLMDQRRLPPHVAADATSEFKPIVYGGTGGAGGSSRTRPGGGGTGHGAQISLSDVSRFSVISGGIGGAGGDLDDSSEEYAAHKARKQSQVKARPPPGRTLSGGTGGAGGPGHQAGGSGGSGEAAQMAAEDVGFFNIIRGGTGGAGGHSDLQGGLGGGGEGSKFEPRLIHSIDDETRRRLPETNLEDLDIDDNLRELLEGEGFRTVGALFELYHSDLPPPRFKRGHPGVLKAALDRFVHQKRGPMRQA